MSASDVQAIIEAINGLIDLLTPKLLISEFNISVTGGSAFGSVTPSRPVSAFRIYVTPSVAGTFSIQRAQVSNPESPVVEAMNNGGLLVANAANIFDILVSDDEQVAFQYSANCTFLSFKVYEVLAMVV